MSKYDKTIERLEREGRFDVDVIPYRTDDALPIDENYDYFLSRWYEKFFHRLIIGFLYLLVRPILFFGCGFRIRGKEKIKGIKSAIVISNHVHYLDCLMVETLHNYFKVFHTGAGFNTKKDIRGKLMKYIGYLPLNGSYGAQKNLMLRIKDILSHGGYVHFYPEHALWQRYKKPRPFKSGAFKYAVKYNVPVIPTFITFESTPVRRFFKMKDRCVLNVLEPVYPKEGFDYRENAEYVRNKCFEETVDCYERVYRTPLIYEEE